MLPSMSAVMVHVSHAYKNMDTVKQEVRDIQGHKGPSGIGHVIHVTGDIRVIGDTCNISITPSGACPLRISSAQSLTLSDST